MKSEVRFPAAFLNLADRVARILNAKQASDAPPLTTHDVIRACTARAMWLPCAIDIGTLDAAIAAANAERNAANAELKTSSKR